MQSFKHLAWFAGVILLFCSGCQEKELPYIYPSKGQIQESFTEPSRTRLEQTYLITMPVAGRIGRITLKPGDKVQKGQLLVPFDLEPLQQAVDLYKARIAVLDDHRLEDLVMIESRNMIKAHDQTLKASAAQLQTAKATADHRREEYLRIIKASRTGAYSESQSDTARLQADTALLDYKKQQFYYSALQIFAVIMNLGPPYVERYLERKLLERKVLEVQLAQAQYNLRLARIVSPIDGVVLRRFDRGDRTLPAGAQLLLIGNLENLEVVSEVMTQDALRLHIGSPVTLQPATGLQPINGKVKRIEPAGFTKLSSLGVEQQRVRVIVSLEGPVANLGVDYRVQAHFFTGMRTKTLVVPRFSVLQAPDNSFYVFKIVQGVLHKQVVTLGLRSDLQLEILKGLKTTDMIVATPDASLQPGTVVKPVAFQP